MCPSAVNLIQSLSAAVLTRSKRSTGSTVANLEKITNRARAPSSVPRSVCTLTCRSMARTAQGDVNPRIRTTHGSTTVVPRAASAPPLYSTGQGSRNAATLEARNATTNFQSGLNQYRRREMQLFISVIFHWFIPSPNLQQITLPVGLPVSSNQTSDYIKVGSITITRRIKTY